MMTDETKHVLKTVNMWSNLVVLYSSILLSYGAPLLYTTHDDPMQARILHAYGALLMTTGVTGFMSGMLKKRSAVIVQAGMLVLLAVVTLHMVGHRMRRHQAGCPVLATSVTDVHTRVFVEILPGLSVEVGSSTVHYFTFDEQKMHDCLAKVYELWVHSTLLLLHVLIACLVCSWRFALAIDQAEIATGEREVPCTVIDEDGNVTETSKMLDMAPPMPMSEDEGKRVYLVDV